MPDPQSPDLALPVTPPLAPMEARSTGALPEDGDWLYEPKWDGFRCLVFRDHSAVELQSKSSKSLTRYFPDVVQAVRGIRARQFVLDCELLVPRGKDDVAFDLLLQRIHPAESRVRRLAEETPAWLVAFDLLARGSIRSLMDCPLRERRTRLERFGDRFLTDTPRIHLTPASHDPAVARRWLTGLSGVDGVMAKDPAREYASGSRDAMWKVKRRRTADCVVGGFRYSKNEGVGSLLLGLYDNAGLLHHVGFCSSFSADDRVRTLEVVEPLIEEPGFTGDRPGGPSRWSTERSRKWQPLRNELVVEVGYDHFTGGRFRHGTTLERWRPEKEPRECTMDQVEREGTGALGVLRSP